MSDPLTSNGVKDDKVEPPEDVGSNLLVEFSNRTLALLNPNKDERSSPYESENEEREPAEESPNWRASIMSNLFHMKGVSTGQPDSHSHSDLKKRPKPPRRQRSKPLELATGLSEDQLSAPYVEEVLPERPDFIRRPPFTSDTNEAESSNKAESSEVGESSTRNKFQKRVKKALALSKANQVFNTSDRNHLQDTGNLGVLIFPSPITVPYLWARRDYKKRKAPPILFDALKLAITDSYNDANVYNMQTIFRVELEYGDVKWVIKRSGIDFISLYINLKKRADLPFIPAIPNGLYKWFRSLFHSTHIRHELQQIGVLKRREQLESYLIQIIRTLNMHVSYELNEFLELSAISITRDMGWKGKEGYFENKVERFNTPICSFRNSNVKWISEWVIVRDSYIAFCSHISSTTPADVFLLDRNFQCDKVPIQGFDRVLTFHGRINIENSSRRIELKADTRMLNEFLESIERVKQSSPWVKQHRFDSYAPIRENAKIKWYVDGKDYFFAVSEAILAAKSEIYIEDWWLSPELYLRRPPSQNEQFRLDRLLKKKAEEGVMIFIVVYKEVKYALPLDSFHTKKTLQELHKNIRVQRHPDHGPEGTMFWAKMVVVDCRIAFIGGLDLCFGRYDTHAHELVDWHPDDDKQHSIWPGQDYSNPRIKDFQNVVDFDNPLIDKSRTPRMPWHDVSIGMCVGQPARDVARHFVQRWNFIKEEKAFDKEKFSFLTPKGEYVSTRDESKFKGTCDVQLLRSSAFWSSGIKLESSIYNAYCYLIRTSKHFIYIENQFFITTTENDSKYVVKNRIGECIVERIKKAHKNNEKFRIIVVMPLLPSFESDLNSSDAGTIRMVMHWQYVSICRGGRSILEKLTEAGITPEKYITFYALRGHDKIHYTDNVNENKSIKSKRSIISNKGKGKLADNDDNSGVSLQRKSSNLSQNSHDVRSDKTSSELKPPEDLRNAPNATSGGSKDSQIRHPLESSFNDENAEPLTDDRIGGEPAIPSGIAQMDPRKAYITEEIYIHSKLMIVDDRYVLCGSANINDRSQLGMRDSEIAIVVEDHKKVETRMNGKPYQASKFAYTLRSNIFKEHLGLLETQDHSSITKSCLPPLRPENLYEAHDKDESITSIIDNPASYFPPKHPKHPTKTDLVVMDPLSDEFYDYWRTTAHNNTETYRSVFRCVPDDNVVDWEQYEKFVPDPARVQPCHVANSEATEEDVRKKLGNVRGHLVTFPTKFLNQENLLGSVISNAVTPAEIFT
ncbi:4974_t:CDS:10 [Funneliformis mosseae]|uniref:Phospholipase n=1 Tax=Funneliformis mosseae TaxID=27381 RepID=A0A9N9GEU7_FUNMO|nr:4974_t:CDS:10 [Funneliformis mosseae]